MERPIRHRRVQTCSVPARQVSTGADGRCAARTVEAVTA